MSIAHLALAAVMMSGPAQPDPFAQLRSAYASRDATAAAAAYTPDAVVTYRYDGAPEERYVGTPAIEKSFGSLFRQIDALQTLDLNFRVTERRGQRVSGIYRLRIGAKPSFGRFVVTLAPDGRFVSDLSTVATIADFEGASGPVLLAADDEALDRSYYAGLTGRYRLRDGCEVIITRSVVRLFARNTCTNEWRGLNRLSGLDWTAGDRVLSDKRLATYRFAPPGNGRSPSLRIADATGAKFAARKHAYETEDVAFASADGTRLTGTLYLPPAKQARVPASVMVHGSGPQDRDGYASIIAVLTDELAANGRAVLVYDKRGSGGSGGDGSRAGFDQLAADAVAGINLLRQRPEVDASKVGLAGSSQAGWVIARAVQSGAAVSDVLLLGAAGAAVTVAEQNLYNTQVLMQCAGLADQDVKLALDQQRAFFAFLKDPSNAGELDKLTAQARTRPAIADWLFPDSGSIDRNAGAWYVVLDTAFDPLPVWRSFRRRALFMFGEHDDSTQTSVAMARLAKLNVTAKVLPGAQHLGLRATSRCQADLPAVDEFVPDLMQEVSRFARSP